MTWQRNTARPTKPLRIRKIQTVTLSLLSVAGFINYIDRGSLGIANTTIRADLGFSATRMGVLLSIFSLSYAIGQLPSGFLVDRLGSRVVLGAGMLLWSLMQTVMGFVSGFRSLAAARMGLALGEAPFIVSGVKSIYDWFDVPERGVPLGIYNGATAIGQSIAPLLLTPLMLAFGWRGMFVLIGLPGLAIAVSWYAVYRDREKVALNDTERDYLGGGMATEKLDPISLAEWKSLFRLRTVWGMMLGFGGTNYTAWFYISWMPGYLETERHVSVAATGWIATIPFLCGSLGMIGSGILADRLIRHGIPPVRCHKSLIVAGLVCSGVSTLLVAHAPGAVSAAWTIGAALFFIYVAGIASWALVQDMTPSHMVASVGAIQNFASFVLASFAPIIAGLLLDRTHSFHLAFILCAVVAFLGALSYLLIVKDPIRMSSQVPVT